MGGMRGPFSVGALCGGLILLPRGCPPGGLGVVPCPGEHERGDAGHRAWSHRSSACAGGIPVPCHAVADLRACKRSPPLPEDVEERPVYAGGLVGLVGHGNEVGVGATDGLQRPAYMVASKGSIRKEQKMAMDSSWATSSKSSSRRVEPRPFPLTNSTLTISPHQGGRSLDGCPRGPG